MRHTRRGRRAQLLAIMATMVALASAYIPAMPSNDTEPDTGPKLTLKWPMGTYSHSVSYELQSENGTGLDQGALVHFTENFLTNEISTTPWIAFINCDTNVTDDMDVDIFTTAQERGAVAAILYSDFSSTCHVNEEFKDPLQFEPILDVFSLTQLAITKLVESTFANINQTLYSNFDANRLNATFSVVMSAINDVYPENGTWLISSIQTSSANPPSMSNNTFPSSTTETPPSNAKKGTTSLAMIVLYVITGCVSLLFCIVILSGAVRAIRNPERYGPRAADPAMGPAGLAQTRTTGLTRAILDTFPVIKFAVPARVVPADPDAGTKTVDLEGPSATVHMPLTEVKTVPQTRPADVAPLEMGVMVADAEQTERGAGSNGGTPRRNSSEIAGISEAEAVGEASTGSPPLPTIAEQDGLAVGRDSCPICMMDFEEGDDLRVLPCQGQHHFHRDCVDPWLLESSGSCPLCREDFHALDEGAYDYDPAGDMAGEAPPASNGGRMSLFLRFKFRRRSTAPAPSITSSPSASNTGLSPTPPADGASSREDLDVSPMRV